jgi:hypothetical protein
VRNEAKNIAIELMAAEIVELRGMIGATRKSEDELRARIDDQFAEIREQKNLAHMHDKEITRLKAELSARPKGRIIRKRPWPDGMRLSVVNCRLVQSTGRIGEAATHGVIQSPLELSATDWEEVDAP